MSDCCEVKPSAKLEKKRLCPDCGEKQNLTSYQTIIHQLRNPYAHDLDVDAAYYFCRNKNCDVVYFSNLGNAIFQNDLRWSVGQKQNSPSRQICYCFDVTYEEVASEFEHQGRSPTKEFVMFQTKAKNCACEVRNPSGKCCLVDFPKG